MGVRNIQSLKTLARVLLPNRTVENMFLVVEALDVASELVLHAEFDDAISLLTRLISSARDAPAELILNARRMLSVSKRLRRSGLLDEVFPYTVMLDRLQAGIPSGVLPPGVLVRPCEGAMDALLVFSAHRGDFWISTDLLHQSLKPFPWHIIYLRDDSGCLHLAGVSGLGPDYSSCVAELRSLLNQLNARRTFCIGGSSGGYSALRYGLDLGADAVISFSGPTTLELADATPASIAGMGPLRAAAPEMLQDLEPIFRRSVDRPRAILYYGDEHPLDKRRAERMRGIEGVELRPLKGYDLHDTLSHIIINQKMDQIHRWLTGTGDARL